MQEEYLIIKSTQTEILQVASKNIFYIKADGNYCQLILTNGEEQQISMQLGMIEKSVKKQLKKTGINFIRIGKSLIINRKYIYKIDTIKQELTLSLNDGVRTECHIFPKDTPKEPRYAEYTLQNNHSIPLKASKDALKDLKNIIEKDLK